MTRIMKKFRDLAKESEIFPALEAMRCEHDHANDGGGNSNEPTYASRSYSFPTNSAVTLRKVSFYKNFHLEAPCSNRALK